MNFIDSFDNHNIYIEDSEIPLGEVYRADFFSQNLLEDFSTQTNT